MVVAHGLPLNVHDTSQAFLESLSHLEPASLPVSNPTRPFWLDPPEVNVLAKEGSTGELTQDADVCIIGSGITGISAAYHLVNRLKDGGFDLNTKGPIKIVVLEARDFCSGATGRNGGHLSPAGCLGFAHNSTSTSKEDAVKQVLLERHCTDSIVDFIKANGLESTVDLVSEGRIDLFFTDEDAKGAKEDYDQAKEAGVDLSKVEWIEEADMKERFGSNHIGVYTPSHNLWPMKLVTQLFLHARRVSETSNHVSLHLHTNTPVTSIVPSSSEVNVDLQARRHVLNTSRGPVHANIIIHATNAYASHLIPHYAGRAGIVPTRGQVAAIPVVNANQGEGLEWLGRSAWTGNQTFEYWFPRPCTPTDSSRLIILGGAREVEPKFEFGTTDDSVINSDISKALKGFLPSVYGNRVKVSDSGVQREWTGIMGFTLTGDPFVGPVMDPDRSTALQRQYISAGYTGHGMPRAYACAEALVDLLLYETQGGRSKGWVGPDWFPKCYLTWERV